MRGFAGAQVILCADKETLRNPAMMGLEDERLETIPWIRTFSDPLEAHAALRGGCSTREVWVLSSDSMEGINLAAGLKACRPELRVVLISFEGSGSLVSRCGAAKVSACIGRPSFFELFRSAKVRYGNVGSPTDGRHSQPARAVVAEIPAVAEMPSAAPGATALIPRVSVDAAASREAFVMTVVSGSGGSGKSVTSLVCAYLAQAAGYRTLLFDADFQFGDLTFLSGKQEVMDSLDLLERPERIVDLVPEGRVPALLAAPVNLESSEVVFDALPNLMQLLSRHFDVIIVNTGSFWFDAHIQLMEVSSKVLFLLDQRPSCVGACSKAVDLAVRCGLPTQPFVYALNRCAKQALLTPVDVSCALKGVTVHELRDGGNDVPEVLGAGQPLDLIESKNPFVDSVRKMLAVLLPARTNNEPVHLVAPRPRKRTGLFGKRKGRVA